MTTLTSARLALLCFMWDTQHAVLFCQSLCMSAFELRCALPCDQSLWEADSAESWQKLRKTQNTPPLFLTALKQHIGARTPAVTHKLNGLSRVLILHGLMSVAWDMNRRDQTSLGELYWRLHHQEPALTVSQALSGATRSMAGNIVLQYLTTAGKLTSTPT